MRGIDNKAVSIYLRGFQKLHQSCLLDLKCKNAYTGTCRGGAFGMKFEQHQNRAFTKKQGKQHIALR